MALCVAVLAMLHYAKASERPLLIQWSMVILSAAHSLAHARKCANSKQRIVSRTVVQHRGMFVGF